MSMLAIISLVLTSCVRIHPGEAGIKVNLTGGDKGKSSVDNVYGYVSYMPGLSDIIILDVRTQHFIMPPLTVQAKGGTNFVVHPSFNYRISANHLDSLYLIWGVKDSSIIRSKMLETSLLTSLREVSNTFTIDSLLNNRTIYDQALTKTLDEKLSPFITIFQFTSGLQPDNTMAAAIADKSASIQRAQAAENKKRETQALADLEIIDARKDSSVKVINAQGEARAIREKQQVINQEYIDYIKASNWDGKLPTTMLGGGSSTLFNLTK